MWLMYMHNMLVANRSGQQPAFEPPQSIEPLITVEHQFDLTAADLQGVDGSNISARHSIVPNGPESPYKLTPYERVLQALANDPQCQKEITLGKRVGFYKIGRELGSGNFSKVRLAVHVLTREKVAIKMMEKSRMDMKSQRLLTREIQNMEKTHHPHIVRLFEVLETLSKVYLVMEFAGGGELYTKVVQNGRLDEKEAKPIFAQVISAVTHLHENRIIHRDIKAENVFLSSPHHVQLGDFGFSIRPEPGNHLNTFCGSPPYAAPELFRDSSYKGELVDIWALGILLYFMLSGNTPFRGDTVADIKKLILTGEYQTPEYFSPEAKDLIGGILRLVPNSRLTLVEICDHSWMSQQHFPPPLHKYSLGPCEGSLVSDPVEMEVWETLERLGITKDMMKNSQTRDSRHSVIGIYRIVLYQIHRRMEEEKEKAAEAKRLAKTAALNSQQQMTNGRTADPNLDNNNLSAKAKLVRNASWKQRRENISKMCAIL